MVALGRTLVIGSALLLPTLAFADTPKNFAELAADLISIIDMGTGVLIVLGFAVYFWGISINILEFEDDPEKRKAYFIWGILVLFVMVSIWGIINLLGNTLFGDGLGFLGGGGAAGPTEAEMNPFSAGEVGLPL
ncbi:hypothetical protein C4585_00640 [Candidatus Parcubacteria bacterium]|nr:MAG: hypothetical protein C4585_00640 [Candidatus Parcubacteria bacterium]